MQGCLSILSVEYMLRIIYAKDKIYPKDTLESKKYRISQNKTGEQYRIEDIGYQKKRPVEHSRILTDFKDTA